jgi:hypothetical protein
MAKRWVNADALGFIPATLASAGIGQLFPVVVLRDKTKLLSARVRAQLEQMGLSAASQADMIVVSVGWVAIIVLTVVWAALIYFSITTEALILGVKTLYIGIGTYFVGVFLSEVKERV